MLLPLETKVKQAATTPSHTIVLFIVLGPKFHSTLKDNGVAFVMIFKEILTMGKPIPTQVQQLLNEFSAILPSEFSQLPTLCDTHPIDGVRA